MKLLVESTYFKNTENYIDQGQWTGFWKKAMKLDYDPVVDVRAIKPKNKGNQQLMKLQNIQ